MPEPPALPKLKLWESDRSATGLETELVGATARSRLACTTGVAARTATVAASPAPVNISGFAWLFI
jgi:hypothetical protein